MLLFVHTRSCVEWWYIVLEQVASLPTSQERKWKVVGSFSPKQFILYLPSIPTTLTLHSTYYNKHQHGPFCSSSPCMPRSLCFRLCPCLCCKHCQAIHCRQCHSSWEGGWCSSPSWLLGVSRVSNYDFDYGFEIDFDYGFEINVDFEFGLLKK